jgi:hypothetical protein
MRACPILKHYWRQVEPLDRGPDRKPFGSKFP